MLNLAIYSGDYRFCKIGFSVNANGSFGDAIELHTGDIVMIWHGNNLGTDLEEWNPVDKLSAIIIDEQSNDLAPFAMGIKNCGFKHPEWRVQLVKSHKDVVDGEHWDAYKFNYRLEE